MHPMKAKALAQLAEISRLEDETLRLGRTMVAAPSEYGWGGSLVAAFVMLPLTGGCAVLTDFTRVMVARSADEVWERIPPRSSPE